MRRILVDYARTMHREKRGGGLKPVLLDENLQISKHKSVELIALDDALNGLAKLDEQQSKVVELRFFAGLSLDESAELLNISRATAARYWAFARAWLFDALSRDEQGE